VNIKQKNTRDFYQRLRESIHAWASTFKGATPAYIEILLAAPDLFHLILKLASDSDVPVTVKAKLAFSVFYFMHPFDVLPEILLGPAGFLDDVVLSAYVLHSIFHEIPPGIVEKYWAGHMDILDWIRRINDQAEQLVGSKLYRKIKSMIK